MDIKGGFANKRLKFLSRFLVLVFIVASCIGPAFIKPQTASASDPWWSGGTSYLKRKALKVTATDSTLPAGSPVSFTFDGRYQIKSGYMHKNVAGTDIKDLKILYYDGANWNDLDRDVIRDSYNNTLEETNITVFFPVQENITEGNYSEKYYVYYDFADEVDVNIKNNKTNVYGSNTTAFLPFTTAPNTVNTIRGDLLNGTISSNGGVDNWGQVAGVNGDFDMALGGVAPSTTARDLLSIGASDTFNATAGTIEMWVKFPAIGSYSTFWSYPGCGAAGCNALLSNSYGANNNRIVWKLNNTGGTLESAHLTDAYINDDNWHYIAFAWDTDGSELNLDGNVTSSAVKPMAATGNDFGVGRATDGNSYGGSGLDEFRVSDIKKTSSQLSNYKYTVDILGNFYGDRKLMEVDRGRGTPGGQIIDAGGDYFYLLSYELLKLKKSDLSVQYSMSVSGYTPDLVGLGADPTTGTVLLGSRAGNVCANGGDTSKIIQIHDNGSAFSEEYIYTGDTISDPEYFSPGARDGYMYASVFRANHICSGTTLTSTGVGAVRINISDHTTSYLELYRPTQADAAQYESWQDDLTVHFDFDTSGNIFLMRYNRQSGAVPTPYTPTVYKIRLSDFSLVTSFGTQYQGVSVNVESNQSGVWIDGRMPDKELIKYSMDGTQTLKEISSNIPGVGYMRGSGHLQLPTSKLLVNLTGGSGEQALTLGGGTAWVADPNEPSGSELDPNVYEYGSRYWTSADTLLSDSDGYVYLPSMWSTSVTKFTSGISSSFSTVSASSSTGTADGQTPVTLSVNLKSRENKTTLPANLSVKIIPSNADGLTMTSATGYPMEYTPTGFAGSTDASGNVTFSFTSTKTNRVTFTVYAEGIALPTTPEVNFVCATCSYSKAYGFSNSSDYTYDPSLVNISSSIAQAKVGGTPGTNWVSTDGGGHDWLYRKKIVIDKSKVAADQTNFPVEIKFTGDTDIGGYALANGHDIRLTSSDGHSTLNYEKESFSISGGAATGVLWVSTNLSSSDTAADTLYLYYGNANASDGENKNAVWDAGYAGVWHFGEASGTIYDSTSNHLDGTPQGSPTFGVSSQIGSGVQLNGTSTQYVSLGTASPLTGNTFTIESWFNQSSNFTTPAIPISGYAGYMFMKGDDDAQGAESYGLSINSNDKTAGNLYSMFVTGTGAGASGLFSTAGSVTAENWTHAVGVISSGTRKIYLDGADTGVTDSQPHSIIATGAPLNIGRTARGGNYYYAYRGVLDEMRISTTARSSSWIATEYANQNNPDTFYSVEGAQGPLPGVADGSIVPTTGQVYRTPISFCESVPDSAVTDPAKYQISADDGTSWYWWNGGAWVATTSGYGEANTDDEINTNIANFSVGTVPKTFNWRGWFTLEDANDLAKIESVTFGYDPLTVPDAPTIGSATAGNAKATVTFTAPADNGGMDITGYTVTSSPGGITASGTASPIEVTGLTNGVAYTFTVHATNAIGNSSESVASSSVTPNSPIAPTATPAPTVITNPTATPTPAPSSSSDSSSSPSSVDQTAIKYNVITNYKTSDYAFVIGVNSLSQDGTTREDTNLTTDKTFNIYDQSPIFRGITYPNSDITIELTDSAGKKIIGKTTSDNNGYWQFQPTEKLLAGEYSIIVTVENKDKGINFTSGQYKIKIAENIKASTPALSTNNKEVKKVTGIKAGITFWAYLIFLILLIALIIFLVLKRRRRK